jgi:hypothetical protein
MNIWAVQDPDNGNFLTPKFKWTTHLYKARLFTHVSNANKARASLRQKSPKKYVVQEFELVHRKDR